MIFNVESAHETARPAQLHFQFEEDFIEDNIRCIPMIVRFKLDAVGIKLKLAEWCKFNVLEREKLTAQLCDNSQEIKNYHQYLYNLVLQRTGKEPDILRVDTKPAWANRHHVDTSLLTKAGEYGWHITVAQWIALSDLQRFALLKLYKPGHENKNFPRAMKEFNLV